MTKRFLPDISFPTIDSMKDSAFNAVESIFDNTVGNGGPARPDFSKFMNKIGAEDLSRPNLFLVRFSNFATTIHADGVMDFYEYVATGSEEQSLFDKALDFGIDAVREYGPGLAMQTELGKKIMGAYNPKLLKTILPGEFVDGILPTGFDINKDLAMLVKAVTLPGTSLDVTKMYMDKKATPVATSRSNDNIKMTFYLRTNHAERQAMVAWMNMVHDQFTNEFGFYDSYAREIEIYPLDRRGIPLSVTKCAGCFPVNVSEVSYDTDSNNAIAMFDVEFTTSTMQTKSFEGSSPFIDEALSIYGNVKTNPILGKLF